MDPLGTEFNNDAFSRSGTILYLETKNTKEDMNTEKFKKYMGGTVCCIKGIIQDTKECGQY